MTGKLIGVGVGPGDPELMTLKAVKIIENAAVIAIPDTGGESGVAFDIASKIIDMSQKEQLKLHMPMTRDQNLLNQSHDTAAAHIIEKLDLGLDVVFLTLGDPTVYSTYIYIQRKVAAAGYETEIAEGIPSFCAAAARLNIALCEGAEALHIIPASYPDDSWLHLQGTKVLMKSGRSFDKVRQQLADHGLLEKAVMVERCTMEN